MMPIILQDNSSIPSFCQQYLPLIQHALSVNNGVNLKRRQQIAYLTIDEHPVATGHSQRRSGLHIEAPGRLPILKTSDKGDSVPYIASGRYVTGAEHHWGGGMMMRNERFEGGIFMVSNLANTCAVWNCMVRDNDGSIVGSHGEIERLRPLLGPPSA